MNSVPTNSNMNWKYTSLESNDLSSKSISVPKSGEETPLLQSMENEGFGTNRPGTEDNGVLSHTKQTESVKIHRIRTKTDQDVSSKENCRGNSEEAIKMESVLRNTPDYTVKANPNDEDTEQRSAIPKTTACASMGNDKTLPKLDIVRKISELSLCEYQIETGLGWQLVGSHGVLRAKRCQRLYAKSCRTDDLVLFYTNGRFYAMDAWCSHMGGPLFDGDIENYKGRCHVMCPWHSYMFDLETGSSEIGLKQNIYEMKYEGGQVYIRYHSELTTEPCRRSSDTKENVKKVPRKTSVLEAPLKLS